jgi:hypothetical protein
MSDQGPAAQIPLGPVKGKFYSRPELFNQLGRVRPLGPGEYVDMDGNWASEMTYTLRLGNHWSVVPGLWVINGVPTRVNEDQAIELAQQSGLIWPTFKNSQEADKFAIAREAIWEKTPHGRSDQQKPLWSKKWPPNEPAVGQGQGIQRSGR